MPRDVFWPVTATQACLGGESKQAHGLPLQGSWPSANELDLKRIATGQDASRATKMTRTLRCQDLEQCDDDASYDTDVSSEREAYSPDICAAGYALFENHCFAARDHGPRPFARRRTAVSSSSSTMELSDAVCKRYRGAPGDEHPDPSIDVHILDDDAASCTTDRAALAENISLFHASTGQRLSWSRLFDESDATATSSLASSLAPSRPDTDTEDCSRRFEVLTIDSTPERRRAGDRGASCGSSRTSRSRSSSRALRSTALRVCQRLLQRRTDADGKLRPGPGPDGPRRNPFLEVPLPSMLLQDGSQDVTSLGSSGHMTPLSRASGASVCPGRRQTMSAYDWHHQPGDVTSDDELDECPLYHAPTTAGRVAYDVLSKLNSAHPARATAARYWQ